MAALANIIVNARERQNKFLSSLIFIFNIFVFLIKEFYNNPLKNQSKNKYINCFINNIINYILIFNLYIYKNFTKIKIPFWPVKCFYFGVGTRYGRQYLHLTLCNSCASPSRPKSPVLYRTNTTNRLATTT